MSSMEKRIRREISELNVTMEDRTILYQSYEIILPPLYPFRPPIIKKHNMDIYNALTLFFIRNKPFIDKYNIRIDCICCTTLTCTWSPCNTIRDVLYEIQHYSSQLALIQTCKYGFKYLPFDDHIFSCIMQYLL